ncbi:GGDEF domain-containing protein [Aliiglaciecola sp. CAU 1673]|uniref:GGDEF domain-containing protein n=1 Tax=Aliiglaciecola sp. CAU 1673 TaxID=3032595 RepID=UPI0023DC0054|nr:GGDEF domain-containing protein [Aliiglaciecola sp. CAU 1673]MDF2178798.1 GGDEF domain-containing protein [Aliiglaciecola sp. CAU 1673]
MKLIRHFATLTYLLLSILTIILLVWQHLGMNITYRVFPNPDIGISIFNDDVNGGLSESDLHLQNGTILLDCEVIANGLTHPFCGINLSLGEPGNEWDLSDFTQMKIRLSMTSSPPDTLMIYLVNQEQNDDGTSRERANLRTLSPSTKLIDVLIPMNSFHVPSWWILLHPDGKQSSHVQLDKVSDLRVTTGDATVSRQAKIQIENIQISGKWVSSGTLYLALLSLWVLTSLSYSAIGIYQLYTNAKRSQSRAAELQEINQFLSIEKNKYESMAKTDPLTGALNRAGLRDVLDKAVQRLLERKRRSSLLMLDIDHFKQLNDSYGHDVGDKALMELVRLIQLHTRDGDFLARWGGEEFALICLNTNIASALKLAEKIRSTIMQTPLAGHYLTCSIGVCELKSADIQQWFKLADQALYQAKAQGRNQVIVA